MVSSARMWWLGAALLVALGVASTAQAQNYRYIGRATAVVQNESPASGDVGAGGTDAQGNVIEEKTCAADVTDCFNESTTAGIIPGLLVTATASTLGGTRDEGGEPRPGFPRVESSAQASAVLLPGPVAILIGPTTATADALTGELTGSGGPVLLNLGGNDITIPPDNAVEVPGQFTLFGRRETRANKNGLAIITVDGAIIHPDPAGPYAQMGDVVLGRATAGIEIPFTEGGGGGGSCSVARGQGGGGLELLGLLGLLWMIARRRGTPASKSTN